MHRAVTEEIADEQYADHVAVWEDFCAKFTSNEIKPTSERSVHNAQPRCERPDKNDYSTPRWPV